MSLTPILYDVAADLYKWPLAERTPRTGDTVRPDMVHGGTLAGCVREFMKKPISQRPLYEIFAQAQPALTKTILSASDNNPISANQIRLQTSLIDQEHRPIRLRLLAGLSFRQ
jgi:hypothetical protein